MERRKESPATFLGGRGSITDGWVTYNQGCEHLGCREKLLSSGLVACVPQGDTRGAIWKVHDALATESKQAVPTPVERRTLGVGYNSHW
jgi:Rieske Fe-S protein